MFIFYELKKIRLQKNIWSQVLFKIYGQTKFQFKLIYFLRYHLIRASFLNHLYVAKRYPRKSQTVK